MIELDFLSILDEKAQFLYNFSDDIWANPETAFTEFHAAERYCRALRSEGFAVTENLAGIPTAFSGRFGSGHPVIGVLAEFDRVIGLDRLKALHLNDSKNPCGAHKDRHEKIGQGYLGLETFRRILHHPALQGLPMILETPNELPGYAEELALLRTLGESLN